MSLLILAVIGAIAGLYAHAVALRKSRNANLWTFATVLFPPALLGLLLLPEHADEEDDAAHVESHA